MPDKYPSKRINEDSKLRFLEELAKHGGIMRAAEKAEIAYNSLLNHRKKCPLFDSAVLRAQKRFGESLESEAYRRAVEGTKRPVYYKGEVVGHILEFSDRMLELLLKKNVPEFREKVTADVNIRGGVLVVNAEAKDVNAWLEKHGGEK